VESLAAALQLAAELPALAAELAEIVGADGVVARPSELAVYECDGWTIAKSAPDLLVLPRTTAHVSGVLAALERRGVAFVPRGAGTGLSGGCLPLNAPVMVCTSRMNHIVACDLANRRIEVESGVVNLNVTNAVKAAGYFYAPDPSSQAACTIGGRIDRRAFVSRFAPVRVQDVDELPHPTATTAIAPIATAHAAALVTVRT